MRGNVGGGDAESETGKDPVDLIVETTAAIAKSTTVLMGKQISPDDRKDMDRIIYRARHLFNQLCLFAAVTATGSTAGSLTVHERHLRPNIHVATHFPAFAEEYASPVNCNTLTGENLHSKILSRADRNGLEALQEAEEHEIDVDQSADATHLAPSAINRIPTENVATHPANEGKRLPLRSTDATPTWRRLIRLAYEHDYGKARQFPSFFENRAVQWSRKFGFTDRDSNERFTFRAGDYVQFTRDGGVQFGRVDHIFVLDNFADRHIFVVLIPYSGQLCSLGEKKDFLDPPYYDASFTTLDQGLDVLASLLEIFQDIFMDSEPDGSITPGMFVGFDPVEDQIEEGEPPEDASADPGGPSSAVVVLLLASVAIGLAILALLAFRDGIDSHQFGTILSTYSTLAGPLAKSYFLFQTFFLYAVFGTGSPDVAHPGSPTPQTQLSSPGSSGEPHEVAVNQLNAESSTPRKEHGSFHQSLSSSTPSVEAETWSVAPSLKSPGPRGL
ncbi:hypothetical protein CHGG_00192 [Chaetomium globosum CBS 148.51]|uniref:Uncharacterized protein n=1 Tax=Chaetomium globosum (strain ATCC 6205 / CBS 148.51 / DSM 1962 / NBRC 6347 / NRRL 1970) TaxID=306901 RepID=Q2HHW2_CHAGB|nr:uncharacterized protein CHGG_00192 [Chaetomium globosum CBS 148.51]EAQ91957.1 hypothetical protein CHGG_00192 [Chaetomium globosum CBS 148.51]